MADTIEPSRTAANFRLGDVVEMSEGWAHFHDLVGVQMKIVSLRLDPEGIQWASAIEREERHRGQGVYDGEITDLDTRRLKLVTQRVIPEWNTKEAGDLAQRVTGKPPAGYSKLPQGTACKCFKLWQDAPGSYWCCNEQAATPPTQGKPSSGLLPCPFCGGAMEEVTDEDGHYFVHPGRKGMERADCWLADAWVSDEATGEGSIGEWNTRAAVVHAEQAPMSRRDEIVAGAFYKTRGDQRNLPHIVGPLEHDRDDGDAPWKARVYDQVWKWGYDGLANADGSPHNRDLVERVYRPECRSSESAVQPASAEIELVYGLLWLVPVDRGTFSGNAVYLARKSVWAQLDRDGRLRGLKAAQDALADYSHLRRLR